MFLLLFHSNLSTSFFCFQKNNEKMCAAAANECDFHSSRAIFLMMPFILRVFGLLLE